MSDPIADMLTRIRNGSKALLPVIVMPHSKIKESIARLLKEEGYIASVTVEGTVKPTLTLQLKYQGRKGIIGGLKRASRPGRRLYVGSDEIPRVLSGMGTAILSTSRGVMTGTEARRQKVGGEFLCTIW